jgi:hypothetical protein
MTGPAKTGPAKTGPVNDWGRLTGACRTNAHNGVVIMYQVEELATEHSRAALEQAVQLRHTRRFLTLRRARRMERKAERRMVEAWRRASEMRATVESLDY